MLKVEIWSDVACPFCYIGKRRFEAALEQFPGKADIEVIYRSFELDPHAEKNIGYDVHDMLSKKYGMSRSEAKAMNANVGTQAEALGLQFNFDTLILTNTFDAHRLTHFAAQYGKRTEMTDRLFKAYFTDSKHLGDPVTLAELAAEIGLDPVEAAKIIAGDQFSEEVRAEEQEAARLGIRGVPYFVIDRKYAVSGAQPSELFLQALEKAWSENQPLTVLNNTENAAPVDAACDDGFCTPPDKK